MNLKRQMVGVLVIFAFQLYCSAEDPVKEIQHPIAGKLVLVPAGEFKMGSPDSDREAGLHEQPQHLEKIESPFYIGAYEVTVAQFRQFVSATGYETEAERDGVGGWGFDQSTRRFDRAGTRYTWKDTGFEQKGQHPVVNVSWNDCIAFCEWLSGEDGSRVFRLPTESEWEYSARGGTSSIYSHGDNRRRLVGKENLADQSIVSVLAPEERNIIDQAAPWTDRYSFSAAVGSFKPNPFGLYDMHGNATEWVSDWYDEDTYVKAGAKAPSEGTHKVYRGGSWAYGPANARSASRHRFPPNDRWCHLGFRVVAEVPR